MPAKLILINGFNASGKSTIAQHYIAEHSLALSVEADSLVDHIGDWTSHREAVKELAFKLVCAMARAYLPSGHDVVLPYIVTSPTEVEAFESIARECDAKFYEFVLHDEKAVAFAKLLKRGKNGQASSPAVTAEHLPTMERNYADMERTYKQRPGTVIIPLANDAPDETYRRLIEGLS